MEDGSGLGTSRIPGLLVQAGPERLQIHRDQDWNEAKPAELLYGFNRKEH